MLSKYATRGIYNLEACAAAASGAQCTGRSTDNCTPSGQVCTLSLDPVFHLLSFLILSVCSKLQHLEVLQGQVVIISTEGVLKLNSDVVETTPDDATEMPPERLSAEEFAEVWNLHAMDSEAVCSYERSLAIISQRHHINQIYAKIKTANTIL